MRSELQGQTQCAVQDVPWPQQHSGIFQQTNHVAQQLLVFARCPSQILHTHAQRLILLSPCLLRDLVVQLGQTPGFSTPSFSTVSWSAPRGSWTGSNPSFGSQTSTTIPNPTTTTTMPSTMPSGSTSTFTDLQQLMSTLAQQPGSGLSTSTSSTPSGTAATQPAAQQGDADPVASTSSIFDIFGGSSLGGGLGLPNLYPDADEDDHTAQVASGGISDSNVRSWGLDRIDQVSMLRCGGQNPPPHRRVPI